MNRFDRNLRQAALLIAGMLLLGSVGCKKQPFVQIVEQTLYLGMPAEVAHLASIDMKQLRLSEGFNDAVKELEATTQTQVRGVLDALHDKIGFDPFRDIDQAIVGARNVSGAADPAKETVLILSGNFKDGPAKLDKLRDWLAEDYLADAKKVQGQHSSGIATYKLTGKSQYDVKVTHELNFAFPTPGMMVFSQSATLLGAALDVISGQTEGIQKDKAWMATLKRPNIGAAIWAVGNITPEFAKELAAQGKPDAADQMRSLKQYYLDLNFTPDFAMHVGLVCESIDAATKLANQMRTGYDQMKTMAGMFLMPLSATETTKMLNSIKILNELEVVRVTLTMTADDWRKLRDELPRLMGTLQKMQAGQGPMPLGPGMGLPPMPPGAAPK